MPIKKLILNGDVKARLKRLLCTFIILFSGVKVDEHKPFAKWKGKVIKTGQIQNSIISRKRRKERSEFLIYNNS